MSKNDTCKEFLLSNQLTWFITGVAGFIGSNLLETLLKLDQKVIGVDNFVAGHKRNLDEVLQNCEPSQRNNFKFHEINICDLPAVEHVINNVDIVLHQAAIGSVPRSILDPITTHDNNVTGFLNVLLAAKNNGVKRFVYASSSSVYGDSPTLPKIETQIGKPLSPYAVSKCTNELYANVFAECFGIETIGLRYFNVFGARQDPSGMYAAVIPLWIKALLANEPVYINGDGETTRDFCYVENVVQANLLAAMVTDTAALNTSYNVAVGEKATLNELFYMLAEILGCKDVHPTYREFRAGDIRHSLADITKANKLLGYLPQFKLKDGLLQAMRWYRKFFERT